MAKAVLDTFGKLDGGFEPVGVKYRKDEHCEQVALIQWCAWMEWKAKNGEVGPEWADVHWLFAVPNGGERDRIVAGRMKAEGVKSGVADLMLPVARGGYFGLFIEMKRHNGGTVSESQTKFLEFVGRGGYANTICYGVEPAIHAIKTYLTLKRTKRGQTE